MGIVTIPSNYDENRNDSVVPICMDDTDFQGVPIFPGWFELGVAPVADSLRKIANRALNDPWRVSEIAETAVHSLWGVHRENLGEEPGLRVLRLAHCHAEDMRVGGRRARRKSDVDLFSSTLENLQSSIDLVAELEAKDTLEQIMNRLDEMGLERVREMVPMMLRDCTQRELTSRFGGSRNTISHYFYRHMRRAALVAGISR